MNRRTILKGGIVLAVTGHTAVASGEVADPIIFAIQAFEDGCAAFNAAPDDEDDDRYCYLWRGPHDVLSEWTETAKSREGAIAALALALKEDSIGPSELVTPMMKAALGYLEAGR